MAARMLFLGILTVIFTILKYVNGHWNFTVLTNGTHYSFYDCTCTLQEVTCPIEVTVSTPSTTSISPHSTKTLTAASPTSTNSPIARFYNCSCANQTVTNLTDTGPWDNVFTMSGYSCSNSTNYTCVSLQDTTECPTAMTNTTQSTPATDTCTNVTGYLDNLAKYFVCFLTEDLPQEEVTTPSTPGTTATSTATSTSSTTTTTTPTTSTAITPATSTANTTAMVIISTIVGINIVLGIGVCVFIMCKRRQINSKSQKKVGAISNDLSGGFGQRSTEPPNDEPFDRHRTLVKTFA